MTRLLFGLALVASLAACHSYRPPPPPTARPSEQPAPPPHRPAVFTDLKAEGSVIEAADEGFRRCEIVDGDFLCSQRLTFLGVRGLKATVRFHQGGLDHFSSIELEDPSGGMAAVDALITKLTEQGWTKHDNGRMPAPQTLERPGEAVLFVIGDHRLSMQSPDEPL